jgi:hypothetical protein
MQQASPIVAHVQHYWGPARSSTIVAGSPRLHGGLRWPVILVGKIASFDVHVVHVFAVFSRQKDRASNPEHQSLHSRASACTIEAAAAFLRAVRRIGRSFFIVFRAYSVPPALAHWA